MALIFESQEQRMASDEEDCFYAMQLASSSVFPMVMQAAIELGLLDIISRAGSGAYLSPVEIAFQLPTKNPKVLDMVDRILRLLASYSVVTCTLKHNHDGHDGPVLRLYGLTPVTKYYLRDQDASLASGMQLLHDKVFKDSWYFLKEAVLEGGIPFNKVHGMHAFEYPSKDSRFNHIFNKAMISHTTLVINKVLDKYKGFEDLKELVDVGRGLGLTLKMITSKYPNIKSINFDLSHVIQDAPPYPGVQHIQGDMFVGVPKGEVILLKCILHDWSDDRCLEILKNCYAELPDDGKVIVIELILPEAPETSAAVRCIMQIDLVMMTQNPGGKERTKQDFESLARRTGFKGIKSECFVCNYCVLEFCK